MIIMPFKYTTLRNLARVCDFFLRSGKMRPQQQTVGVDYVNKTSPFLRMELCSIQRAHTRLRQLKRTKSLRSGCHRSADRA